MNFMHQIYNQIHIQTNKNITVIELEVTKSVFKHALIPYAILILIFIFFGCYAFYAVLTSDPEGGFIFIIWSCLLVAFGYKTLTESLWLLYGRERITLDHHQLKIEKFYPLLHFEKNYIQTNQIEYIHIKEIKYQFWTQPYSKSTLPKVTDGQIQIKTQDEKYYIGINLSKNEAEQVISKIQQHISKNFHL